MQASFPYDLPTAPDRWQDSHPVILSSMPIWLRVSAAVKYSSRARAEIEGFVERRLVQVAWRKDRSGKLQPLIYAPSLWSLLDSLAERPQEAAVK